MNLSMMGTAGVHTILEFCWEWNLSVAYTNNGRTDVGSRYDYRSAYKFKAVLKITALKVWESPFTESFVFDGARKSCISRCASDGWNISGIYQ
jgi:hypothetical protein